MSSEAFIFNNKNIDQVIEGFRTLRVDGRDSYTKTITTAIVNHRNKYLYRDYDLNVIDVTFELTANDQYESEARLANLKGLLREADVEFSFLDSQYYWVGTVTSFSLDDPSQWQDLVGTISITTMTPFKYRPVRELTSRRVGNNQQVVMTDPQMTFEAFPKHLSITMGDTAQVPSVWNYTKPETQFIEFSQAVPAGAQIEIDFDDLTVLVNGDANAEGMGWITLDSDFGNMRFQRGAQIEVVGSETFTLNYQVEVL
jgi:hypothetical protein